MKVLITGITGFIGSNIAKKCIREGYSVVGIIRKNSDIKKYNMDKIQINYGVYDGTIQSLIAFMNMEKPDVVIHCAALFIAEHSTEQVEALVDSNIKFSAYLYEAMLSCGIRKIINTTTSWEHYNNEDFNPVCLYAATKKAASVILKYYIEAEEFRAITMTIYDSYGEDDKRGKILSVFDKIAHTENYISMSAGEQQINFVHIKDIECAFMKALEHIFNMQEKEKVFHIRSKEVFTLKKVAELYETIYRVKLPIHWGMRKYRKREVMEVYPHGDTMQEWHATIPLCKGLNRENEAEKQKKYEK